MNRKIVILHMTFLFFSYYFVLDCCAKDRLCNRFEDKSKKVAKQIDTISYKNYTLKIISYYINDNMSDKEANQLFPVCLKQEVFCIKDERIINKCDYKVRTIEQTLFNGNRIKILDNVIVQVGIIEGLHEAFFLIYGYGGCNSCSELYSIFSMEGEKIYFLYQKGQKEFKNIGNLEKICLQYGIDEKQYLLGHYRKKNILLNNSNK